LDALTLEKVNAAIQKHLKYNNLWVIFITKDGEGLKQKLLAGTPTNITYAGKQPQEILDEDKIIAAYPVPVKPECWSPCSVFRLLTLLNLLHASPHQVNEDIFKGRLTLL
jgi:hypothetical protein